MGRPKLDLAMTQRIIDLIRAGNYLEVAATAAGIQPRATAPVRRHRPTLLVELARRRFWDWSATYVRPDRRTPEERRRENEELLRQLPAMLKPELYRWLVELVGVDDYWDPILKAGLDQEAYLDVLEAIVAIEYVPKNAMP